jgi:hypothetical protein
MSVDDTTPNVAEDPAGETETAIDWSGPGDEGPEESITFGTSKPTNADEPEAEDKDD